MRSLLLAYVAQLCFAHTCLMRSAPDKQIHGLLTNAFRTAHRLRQHCKVLALILLLSVVL